MSTTGESPQLVPAPRLDELEIRTDLQPMTGRHFTLLKVDDVEDVGPSSTAPEDAAAGRRFRHRIDVVSEQRRRAELAAWSYKNRMLQLQDQLDALRPRRMEDPL